MTQTLALDLGQDNFPGFEVLGVHGFIAPSYSGKSLSTVLPAITSALGQGDLLDAVHGPSGSARGSDAQQAWGLEDGGSFCLIIVDGLGYLNIQEHSDDAPFLAELNRATPAKSGFPSTTATSMSVLGTGASAGTTGMVGYSALDPASGELGNFVSWRNLPAPLKVQRQPVLFEELVRRNVSAQSIGLSRYNGSEMTQAALRGPTYFEAADLRSTFARAVEAVSTTALTHVYWAEIDKVGHYYGVGSLEWRTALREFDAELARFVENLPAGTQVVLTADHGMVNVDFAQRIDIAKQFGLARGLRGIAGEPRCTHVYFNSGGAAKKALQQWTDTIGDTGVVLTRSQIIDMGLYGPVSAHVEPWIGHLMVLSKGAATLVDSDTMAPMAIGLKGVHGSLTHTEVLIPGIALKS